MSQQAKANSKPARWLLWAAIGLCVVLIVGMMGWPIVQNARVIHDFEQHGQVALEAGFLLEMMPESCKVWLFQLFEHRDLVGLLEVSALNLTNVDLTDADLVDLRNCDQLKSFCFPPSKVTGTGLKYLHRHAPLTFVDATDSQFTDIGLEHLANFDSLLVLELNRTKVTDAGMVHLSGLIELRALFLNYTFVGDPGLVHLAELPRLSTLSLEGTRASDAGLKHLAGCHGRGCG